MLDESEIEKLKEQESFRLQLQRELSSPKRRGLWEVLNSQFFLWILGSVVISLITFLWNHWNDTRLQEERTLQATINQQRDDSQFLATLLPFLTHSDLNVRIRACDVIDTRYAGQKMPPHIQRLEVKVIDEVKRAGLEKQSDETKVLVANVVRGLDKQQTPDPSVAATIQQLPARVYLQIFDENKRPDVQKVQMELQKAGYLVPGIENVQEKATSSQQTEVRFFNDSDNGTAERVKSILIQKGYIDTRSKQLGMKTKPGTIEVWFTKSG